MGGCATEEVDESLLPTRVATLAPNTFAGAPVAKAPTLTPEPEATLAEPEATAATESREATTGAVVTGTNEAPEEAMTQTVGVTETAPIAATASVTDSSAVTETASVFEEERRQEATPETGEEITATTPFMFRREEEGVVTATGEITASSGFTATESAAEQEPENEAQADQAETDETPTDVRTDPQIDPRLSGLPPQIAAALETADPARAQQLITTNACVVCHSMDSSAPLPGPTWQNLAETAATRVPGQSAGMYLYTSITNPNAYIVEGYQPNVMIQTYGQTLSDQDLADILAYLLTLHDGN
jgi:mono/diheme cytochrome c family protein